MKADAKTEAAAMAVLERFNRAYAERDLNGVLALFAPDPDVVLIGTGADERRVGLAEVKAQLERDLSQSEAVSMDVGWTSVSAAGPVAWLAAEITVKATVAGQDTTFSGRMTAVLEKRADRWLIVQWHGSLPAGAQPEGQSFPT